MQLKKVPKSIAEIHRLGSPPSPAQGWAPSTMRSLPPLRRGSQAPIRPATGHRELRVKTSGRRIFIAARPLMGCPDAVKLLWSALRGSRISVDPIRDGGRPGDGRPRTGDRECCGRALLVRCAFTTTATTYDAMFDLWFSRGTEGRSSPRKTSRQAPRVAGDVEAMRQLLLDLRPTTRTWPAGRSGWWR